MDGSPTKRKWLGLVIALQVVTLTALWGARPSISRAVAQGIPDAGAQQEQLIAQSKATNEKLDRIITLLSGGDLRVTVRPSEEKR